ncbi:MAG: hypothetical protein PHV42_04365 [Candidatus Pacebacteria bacterium]|nr:hypothetical protein [Candidatus Paceibacterota bacterium]
MTDNITPMYPAGVEAPGATSPAAKRLAERMALLNPPWKKQFRDFMGVRGEKRIITLRCLEVVRVGNYNVPILDEKAGDEDEKGGVGWEMYPSIVFTEFTYSLCHITMDAGLVIERSSTMGDRATLLREARKYKLLCVAGDRYVKEITESS